jgi:hypothetical protein
VARSDGKRSNQAKAFILSDTSPAERAVLSMRLWRNFGHAVPRAGATRRCWITKTKGEPHLQLDATRGMVAARVVYALYVGDVPAGYHVRHACGNGRCLRPDHLVLDELGSRHRCPRCVEHRRQLEQAQAVA